MAILYRISAAAKLTGLSVDTLRAWERRYSAVVPARGDQQRGYSDADVERLMLLRMAVEKGHAISSVANLQDSELRGLLAEHQPVAERVPDLLQPLRNAIDDFNYRSLNDQMGRMASVLPPEELVHQVVLPLMREVGERWHNGQVSVGQEHMVTAIMHHVLGSLMRLYRPGPNAVQVLFTTPEGELHALGILAAAMLAAGAGLSPVYLGPSLPAKEIAQAARSSGAKVVVLQVTESGPGVRKRVLQILDSLPVGVELWIGGADLHHANILQLNDFNVLAEQYRRFAASI
jgi:DNA-binding transcriptional MerR regulator